MVTNAPRSSAPAPSNNRRPAPRFDRRGKPAPRGQKGKPFDKSKPFDADHEILFQTYFKSVGPRTYAAQVKKANNGNHYLVLTEGKRDDKTGEVRKCRVFIYSEDFKAFFKMMHESAVFVRDNPMSKEAQAKRERFWAKQAAEDRAVARAAPSASLPTPAPAAAAAK